VSLRPIIHKYSGLLVQNENPHQRRSAPGLLFSELLKMAEKVSNIELDIRRVIRQRDDLSLKIMVRINAGAGVPTMPVTPNECTDKLQQLIVEWSTAIENLKAMANLYDRVKQAED
jgi:hypothetical protein